MLLSFNEFDSLHYNIPEDCIFLKFELKMKAIDKNKCYHQYVNLCMKILSLVLFGVLWMAATTHSLFLIYM
jgi:hypothetical protein